MRRAGSQPSSASELVEAPRHVSAPGRRWPRLDGAAWVALAFVAVGVTLVSTLRFVDDEGMLTMAAATAALDQPLDVLLAQKFRPVGTLLNLPVAALGWQAFLVWHVLLAGLAVLLLGRVAARLGGSGPVAALVLATSPSFVTAALTGQSNTDGLFTLSLSLWLLVVHQRRYAAGLVLGATPWVRYELLPFALVMTAYGLLRRGDRRLFWGLATFPAAFLLAGAAFHGDPLWWLHHPPTLTTPTPGGRFFDHVRPDPGYLAELPVMLLQVTPAWLVPLLVRWRPLGPLERTFLATLALSFTAMVVIPFFAVLNFEHNPRYAMAFLPFVALAAARVAADPPTRRVWPLILALLAAAALVAALADSLEPRLAALTLLLPAAVALVARRAPARAPWALSATAALGLAVLFAGPAMNRLRHALPSPGLPHLARWLAEDPRAQAASVIYTNDMRLTESLRPDHPDLAARVRLLFQFDVLHELNALLDPDNGQRDRVIAALRRTVYGHAVWPCELVAVTSFEGAVFVLRDDYRFEQLYAPEYLAAIADEAARDGQVRLMTGRAAGPGGYASVPTLDAPWLRIGCPGAGDR